MNPASSRNTPQLEAYYMWLKSRGQKWPVFTAQSTERAHYLPNTVIACFLGDGYIEKEQENTSFLEWHGFSIEEEALISKIAKALELDEDQFVMRNLRFNKQTLTAQDYRRYHNASDINKADFNVEQRSMEECLELSPRIIIAFGKVTYNALQMMGFKEDHIILIPTHHPRDMLKDPQLKRSVWDSLKPVLEDIRSWRDQHV